MSISTDIKISIITTIIEHELGDVATVPIATVKDLMSKVIDKVESYLTLGDGS